MASRNNRDKASPSPHKSPTSSVVSSQSYDADTDFENEPPPSPPHRRHLNEELTHRNLHVPPSKFFMGEKPKPLNKKERKSKVKLPQCCTGREKTKHSACVKVINKLNDAVVELDEANNNERNARIAAYDRFSEEIKLLETFQDKQYRDGMKIVVEKNGIQDGMLQCESERDHLKQSNRQLSTKSNKQQSENDKLKQNIEKLTKELNSWKDKCKELSTTTQQKQNSGATSMFGIGDQQLSKIDEMVLKHKFKKMDDEREEKKEARRDARRRKQKDEQGRIGMNLLGSANGGMLNHAARDLIKQLSGKGHHKRHRKSSHHTHSGRKHKRSRRSRISSPSLSSTSLSGSSSIALSNSSTSASASDSESGYYYHATHKHKKGAVSHRKHEHKTRRDLKSDSGRSKYESSFQAGDSVFDGTQIRNHANSVFAPQRVRQAADFTKNGWSNSCDNSEAFQQALANSLNVEDDRKMPAVGLEALSMAAVVSSMSSDQVNGAAQPDTTSVQDTTQGAAAQMPDGEESSHSRYFSFSSHSNN